MATKFTIGDAVRLRADDQFMTVRRILLGPSEREALLAAVDVQPTIDAPYPHYVCEWTSGTPARIPQSRVAPEAMLVAVGDDEIQDALTKKRK
jgi:hypothetical protein